MDIANMLGSLGDAASGLLPGLAGQAAQRNLPSGLFAEALAHLLGKAAPQLPDALPTSASGQPAEGGNTPPELSVLAGIVAWLASPATADVPVAGTGGTGATSLPPVDPARIGRAIEQALDSLDAALGGLLTEAGSQLRSALAALAARVAEIPVPTPPVTILGTETPTPAIASSDTPAQAPRPAVTPELRELVAGLLAKLNGRVVGTSGTVGTQPSSDGATATNGLGTGASALAAAGGDAPWPAGQPERTGAATVLPGIDAPATAEAAALFVRPGATTRPRSSGPVERRASASASRSATVVDEVAASLTPGSMEARGARRTAADAKTLGRLLERPDATRDGEAAGVGTGARGADATAPALRGAPLEPVFGNSWTLPEQRARESGRESGAMRVGLWNRVERAVHDTVASGKSAVVIELKPAHLGDVRVTISATEQAVVARFEADSQTVRAVLESNLHLLRDMLTNAGVDSGRLEVSVGSGGAGASGGGGYGNRFADAQYRAFEPATRQGTESATLGAPTTGARASPSRSSWAVDVLA